MSEETLKKLGFIEAYECLFGTDEYSVKESITEDAGEYSEWQEFTEKDKKQVEKYKIFFVESLKNA